MNRKRLYRACSEDFKPIILMALLTGMRRGEILRLTWKDVNFNNSIIQIRETKNGEIREVPIHKELFLALSKMEIKGKYIFTNKDGSQKKDIRTAFGNALKRAKISNFRFHDLRHTFASHLVMNGVDLLSVKELLGHKTIDMTLRYSHLSPSHKSKALESLKYLDGHYSDTQSRPSGRNNKLSACAVFRAQCPCGRGGSNPPFGIVLSP